MQQSTNLSAELKKSLPNASTSSKMHVKQVKRQSLDEARQKVVEKALRSKSDYVPPKGEEVTELIYKLDAGTGKYRVGLKSGNRWLKHGLLDGNSFIDVDDLQEADKAIDMLVKWTKAGHFDDAIKEVMQTNARRKRT